MHEVVGAAVLTLLTIGPENTPQRLLKLIGKMGSFDKCRSLSIDRHSNDAIVAKELFSSDTKKPES